MIDKLQKTVVDFVYGVARVKREYSRSNPDERILAADGAKGIATKDDQAVERGLD